MRIPAHWPQYAGVALLASTAFLVPLGAARDAAAQAHPVLANVIPDGGTGAIEGKIQSVDPQTRQVTIASHAGDGLILYAVPAVRLDNVEPGDNVVAEFSRTVLWVVAPATAPAAPGATTTVGQAANTPGHVGSDATQISGRVLKVGTDNSFDLVDATGGGVYTIMVTDPNRARMLESLSVGSGITVSLSPLTMTSMTKCGWFGCF
jgi:hypothetical protein